MDSKNYDFPPPQENILIIFKYTKIYILMV